MTAIFSDFIANVHHYYLTALADFAGLRQAIGNHT